MERTVIEPAGSHVIVADRLETTQIDGVELPDNVRNHEMLFGLVVFKGPKVSEYTNIQDLVCFGPYAGKLIAVNGIEFRIMEEDQIEAYIRIVKVAAASIGE
jgi:co-chaperonin GroES (HSP10)